jgi:RNA polymerase sigma-70 factor (ECF subfamily)
MADRGDEGLAHAVRRGLVSHCYRMLGSISEAQQVATLSLQSSGDAYAIATRHCLDRDVWRPLPTSLATASDDPSGELQQRPEVLWLEPIPDDLTDGRPIGLDLVAALQRLPARHRAALILTDIEGWTPTRVADAIGAVDLDEARSHFNPGQGHVADDATLLDRYRDAFEQYDVPTITGFFTDDAIWEMPPYTSWFRGARNIGRLISTHCPAKEAGDQVLVPIKANGQPGFAVYMRDPVDNVHRAFQIQVLALTATGIIHAIAFFDLTLFETFNLPDLLTTLPKSPYESQPSLHIGRADRHHD